MILRPSDTIINSHNADIGGNERDLGNKTLTERLGVQEHKHPGPLNTLKPRRCDTATRKTLITKKDLMDLQSKKHKQPCKKTLEFEILIHIDSCIKTW